MGLAEEQGAVFIKFCLNLFMYVMHCCLILAEE